MEPNLTLLGAVPPPDARHARAYPLGAPGTTIPVGPMVAGMYWHETFWKPTKKPDGTYWIGLNPTALGAVQGGHAICLIPEGWEDVKDGWTWFNQGQTSACVAFACNRLQALNDKKTGLYAPPFYDRCKQLDGRPGDGTYIRVGMDVLRTNGCWLKAKTKVTGPDARYGITANRWARSVDDVLAALGAKATGRIGFLNSWGTSYPHVTYMPAETVHRMLTGGSAYYFEATAVTDKPGPVVNSRA